MTEFRVDWQRAARTGTSEAVLCDPKSAAQIDAILAHAAELGQRLLLTRLGARKFSRLSAPMRSVLDYDAGTRTAILGGLPAARGTGRVAIVCGGTSDLPVAREAERTLAFEGEIATLLADVGVAGLWRLIDRHLAESDKQVTRKQVADDDRASKLEARLDALVAWQTEHTAVDAGHETRIRLLEDHSEPRP